MRGHHTTGRHGRWCVAPSRRPRDAFARLSACARPFSLECGRHYGFISSVGTTRGLARQGQSQPEEGKRRQRKEVPFSFVNHWIGWLLPYLSLLASRDEIILHLTRSLVFGPRWSIFRSGLFTAPPNLDTTFSSTNLDCALHEPDLVETPSVLVVAPILFSRSSGPKDQQSTCGSPAVYATT